LTPVAPYDFAKQLARPASRIPVLHLILQSQNPSNPGQKKRQTEHRTATTAYPCYLPVLGEFSRSWSCPICRGQR